MAICSIVPYQLVLKAEDVKAQSGIVLSSMITFRGEKVFRVGIKFEPQDDILLFVAIDLNRIGMQVQQVKVSSLLFDQYRHQTVYVLTQDTNSAINFQYFTQKSPNAISKECTITFHVYIQGTVEGYAYRLSDRLVKSQLWAAYLTNQLTDVELVIKDKVFSAHKSILASRSPVFAAEFNKGVLVNNRIHIENVEDPGIMEQFLYYLYTGESSVSFASEDLRALAVRFEVAVLVTLCTNALIKVDAEQLFNYGMLVESHSVLSAPINR